MPRMSRLGLHLPGLTKRRTSTFVLAIIGISLALVYVAPLTLVPFPVNTDTQRFGYRNWEATGSNSFNGELLDTTKYITSWLANGDSEKIVAQGQIRYRFPAGDLLRECRYAWYLNDGLGWKAMDPTYQFVGCGPNTLPDQWAALDAVERTLHSPIVGAVRIELQLLIGLLDPSWQVLARDEAYLLPGVGDVWFSKGTYAVGENMIMNYKVGFASSSKEGGAWSIRLYEPADRGGALFKSWSVAEDTRGSLSLPVTSSMFQASTSNIFRVELLNTIVGVKDDDAAVVDDFDLAPVIQSILIEPPGTRRVGDAMTVTVSAAPNSRTGLPIEEYYFHIRQGQADVLQDSWQASPVTTFTIQSDGDVQVNACVRDAERTTCAERINIIVENPDKPWAEDDSGVAGAPWWIWLLIGVFIAGAFGVQLLSPIPPGGRNLLSLFFLGAIGVLLMVYIVIPWFESFLKGLIPGVG